MNDQQSESTLGSIPKERDTKITPPKIERLQLPLGAFLAFRQSGGLKFSSRELVVYPDGRVSYGGPDLSKHAYARAGRKLNDGQIARLRKTLNQAGFFRLPSTTGEQPPDSFAYEIAARLGNRSNFVEVFDGSIPDALQALIAQLSGLFPKAE